MGTMSESAECPSFNAVYTQYRDSIYTYVLVRVNSKDATEDIVSDTFVKVYEKLHTYNPKYAVSTWVYTIARNTLTDHYRKQKETVDIDELELSDDTDALYDLLTHDISKEDLARALDGLSETQRLCITEKFYNEKNAKEIGDSHGMTHESVRKHLSRAIAALRGTLLPLFIWSIEFTNRIIESIV